MNHTNLKTLLAASILLAANSVLADQTPKGWLHAGSQPKDYEMALDHDVVHSGKASAVLKSIVTKPAGFGTLMQTFQAGSFLGKRVRLAGYVRSEDVRDWAGLWMRVDGQQGEPLAFDNMQHRAIKGTSSWTKYEIVLDVPDNAKQVAFGLLLSGAGKVWMDDLSFEPVGADVPATSPAIAQPTPSPSAPTNLDFED